MSKTSSTCLPFHPWRETRKQLNPKLRALRKCASIARRIAQSLAATLLKWRGPTGPAAALR